MAKTFEQTKDKILIVSKVKKNQLIQTKNMHQAQPYLMWYYCAFLNFRLLIVVYANEGVILRYDLRSTARKKVTKNYATSNNFKSFEGAKNFEFGKY